MSADVHEVRAAAMRRDLARFHAILNLDELRILDRVQQRLVIGLERYGHLDLSKPRNWRKERFEERLDALVYDVAEELAAEDAERAELHEAAHREMLTSKPIAAPAVIGQRLAEWETSKTQASEVPSEISQTEIALLAIEDITDHESQPYDFFDVSDVVPGAS